jgi:hypothetical protein
MGQVCEIVIYHVENNGLEIEVLFDVLIPYSDPISQSLCLSSINGSKKISTSMPTCLGQDMRVVSKRYFHLWQNHGGD